MFLEKPTVLHVKPKSGQVAGITVTVLGSEVFVVQNTSQVDVYNSTSLTSTRNFMITGSKQLRGIVSCSHNNCLYVSDIGKKIIYRYDVSNDVTTCWSVSGKCCGLSVTNCYNVLATSLHIRRIQEYTTHGSLIREICLDSSIDKPIHCVQLSTGNFVVSHIGTQHRVCMVDTSGCIIQSYGGSPGSGVGQLNNSYHIAVDINDNVLMTDSSNSRVQLFSSTLTYLGDIVIPGHQLNQPYAVHFDELNHCLYIGEWSGGRLFVLM